MKTLVTGGTGFVGSGVVQLLLEEGHTVRMFTRRRELPEEFGTHDVELAQGDLKNYPSLRQAMEGIDVLYHIGEIRNVSEAASLNNVRLMKEMIAGVREAGISRLVFVSSLTVAGIPKSVPAGEGTDADVVLEDHYTSYKRACENLLASSLPGGYAVVRPAPVYGPGSRYMGGFLNLLEKFGPVGFPFIGNARNIAPLIFVKDLAKAICRAGLAAAAAGETFNLTDGLPHSWYDFLNAVMEGFGKKLRVMPLPPLLLKIPAVPFDLLSSVVGLKLDPVQYVNYFSRDLWFDNAKARTLLEWRPEYDLSRGVSEMMGFYRKKK